MARLQNLSAFSGAAGSVMLLAFSGSVVGVGPLLLAGMNVVASGSTDDYGLVSESVKRTGRTNSTQRRELEHVRGASTGALDFRVVFATDDLATMKGLEQHLYDEYPDAELNLRRAVGPDSPKHTIYEAAKDDYLKKRRDCDDGT
jgi:hypothetical protein